MTLHLQYGHTLYIDDPTRIIEGDKIISVSSEVHSEWNKTRSELAKRSIGTTKYIRTPECTVEVECIDAGMRLSGGIWKYIRNSMSSYREDMPPFQLKGYRVWRLWKVVGVRRKYVQLTLGGIENGRE